MKKRRLWEIISPNPPVRYGLAEKLNVGHWMNVRTPYGERLQVFEHGIGKEGGTSILLRHGYSGGLRSISHDPAEYLVEVSATQRRRREKGVLFAHAYEEAITIDSDGNVKQYSIVNDIYPKIGYTGEWYDVGTITNVSPELGIIFLYNHQDDTTYWYIVNRDFNAIKAGTFGNVNIFCDYTYYNGKLRALFYNLDGGVYVWSEWTKDGMLNITPLELGYTVLSMAGRYIIGSEQEKVYFYDYEDNKLVLSLDVKPPGTEVWLDDAYSKAVGYNKFRVYVHVYIYVLEKSFTELFQLLPEDGSSINIDDFLPVQNSKVYEFYIDDREVRPCNEVYGVLNKAIISRDSVSAYSVDYLSDPCCYWTEKGDTPPYGFHSYGYWVQLYYNHTALSSLDGIDYYSPSFVAPPDTVLVHKRQAREYRIAKGNGGITIYDPDDSIYSTDLYSFDVDTGEIIIEVVPISTHEKVYFRITAEKIERISSPSYYKLVDFCESPLYLYQHIDSGAKCAGNGSPNIDLHVHIHDCREIDPDLFYEAMQEAQYVLSFNGGIIGPPYDCLCELSELYGWLFHRATVRLNYYRGAYLLYKISPNEEVLLSHAGPVPLEATYWKIADASRLYEYRACYYSEQQFVYNSKPLRGIDMDYQCSEYSVYIGQYLYNNYLRVRTNPTFIFRKLDENKYLIYGLSDVVLLEGNTFKQLVYGGFGWNSQIIVNKKVVVESDGGSIGSIIAADEENVRWFGYLNDVRGEYLNDRLISRDTVEYAGSGHNFVIYRRLTNEGWKYYIGDMDTLITGQDGMVLDKPTSKFFDFDAQDVFVFGTRPNIKIKRVE